MDDLRGPRGTISGHILFFEALLHHTIIPSFSHDSPMIHHNNPSKRPHLYYGYESLANGCASKFFFPMMTWGSLDLDALSQAWR